jgi:hypothetical protein
VASSCELGNEVSGSIKCWKFLNSRTTGGFSRRAQLHEVSNMWKMSFDMCPKIFNVPNEKMFHTGENIHAFVYPFF